MIRVGVIGLGKMGKLHLLNVLRMKDVDVVAVADTSERARKSAERFHVSTYDDYSKLIDAEKLDAVIVSLPNFLKRECINCATERKLDIFVDKPLGRTLAEGQEIAKKVEKESVRCMVGLNYRYFDSVEKAKDTVDQGRIGDIVLASSELIMNGPFSHPLVPTPVPDWWLDKELAGGGAVLDLGYHLIDLLTWIFGDLGVEYASLSHRFSLPVEDAASVFLVSRSHGTKCVVNVGWFSKMLFPDFDFRVNFHGTAGYESTDRYAPDNLRIHAVKAGATNILRKLFLRKMNYLSYTYYYSSFYVVLEEFFNMVKTGADSPIPPHEQLNVVRIIDDIYRQAGSAIK